MAPWIANSAIAMSFPSRRAATGRVATYSIYLFSAIISVFFVLKYVHETKGKELEQMEG